ncbi:MAG: hypothetical protein EP310_08620 [Bacteroidetes bacterium]|nr:MAG: hypothetical protein EP310_08620 [Bacteroidota bacterium]
MKNGQKHIINREVLEFTVSERNRAQSIQNKVSEIVRLKLNPSLDQLFSRISGSDEIIRIEQLIIDLGTITGEELENELTDKIISEIRNRIELLLKKSRSDIREKTVLNYSQNQNNTDAGILLINRQNDFLAQFVYYLEHGFLPWWSKSVIQNKVSENSSIKSLLKEVFNVERHSLRRAVIPLFKKEKIRKRLIFQCNHSCLHELLKKLNTELFTSYSDNFQLLLTCAGSAQISKLLTESFYKTVLLYFSVETELNTENQKINFVKDILDLALAKKEEEEKGKILFDILRTSQIKTQVSQSKEYLPVMVAVIQVTTELTSKSKFFQQMIQDLTLKNDSVINTVIEQAVIKTNKEIAEKNKNEKYKAIKGSGEFLTEEGFLLEEKVRKNNSETDKEKENDKYKVKPFSVFSSKPETDREQILIYNAGLVIIHPFLKYFFEGLNLLNAELQFKDENEAFKAVHLLQFIATGKESTPEAELSLNKILCGLDVTEPVPLNVPLSNEEKEECLFLIKTVLERWEALKTTNPAALRETFIQRDGMLKQAGQSWNLTIERNTFDVMLEKLPWSYTLVKLPWCEQILYVEW